MSFQHSHSTTKRWYIDADTLSFLHAVQNTPIHINSSGAPTLQPIISFAKMPVSSLTLRWQYEVITDAEKVILDFIFEDTYSIVAKTLTIHNVREIVALSYDRLALTFDELNSETKLDAGLEEPTLEEFEALCLSVTDFLKKKLGESGRR